MGFPKPGRQWSKLGRSRQKWRGKPPDQICHRRAGKKIHKSEKSWRGKDGTCMPRRAKMKMKRTRRTSRATMEAMESTRDLTKPPMAFQYLWEDNRGSWRSILSSFHLLRDFEGSQKTDTPHNRETHGWHNLTKFIQGRKAKMWKQTKTVLTPTSNLTSVYSKMELHTTKKSNLLKSETM